jgi:hypothetical protein
MIDELLLMIIIAGTGLTVAYLRAEYVLHRRFKAAEREKLIVQRELHAKRVRLAQNGMPMLPAPVPSIRARAFQKVRVLARVLRIYIQERNIHRFRIRT